MKPNYMSKLNIMKTNKSQKEAVLRAHQSIEENQQDQEKLYRPTPDKMKTENPAEALDQSHTKKMGHWQNLRKMDAELAQRRKDKE